MSLLNIKNKLWSSNTNYYLTEHFTADIEPLTKVISKTLIGLHILSY